MISALPGVMQALRNPGRLAARRVSFHGGAEIPEVKGTQKTFLSGQNVTSRNDTERSFYSDFLKALALPSIQAGVSLSKENEEFF